MHSKSILYFCCFLLILGFAGYLILYHSTTFPQAEFKKLSEIQHASHADYIFLEDASGQEWIYKQITETSPDDQMAIVLEAFASEIAAAMDIPINRVKLISGIDSFPLRIFNQYPGSLHLKVPGTPIEESLPWENFDIHQKYRSPFMVARLGPLHPEEIGLRREIIQNMARHPDLPKIIALDTYLGNIDRSNPNIFYETETDSFYGIDMGNCLIGNLAQCAHDQLSQFSQTASFSDAELKALQEYRQALFMLATNFPPHKMIELLERNLELGGFVPSNPLLWNEDGERLLAKWKKNIEQNYQSSLKLVELLEKIGNMEPLSPNEIQDVPLPEELSFEPLLLDQDKQTDKEFCLIVCEKCRLSLKSCKIFTAFKIYFFERGFV